jgi:hypothetical protein
MRLPHLTSPQFAVNAPRQRGAGRRGAARPAIVDGFTNPVVSDAAGVEPQGCSTLKKIGCAAAVAACAAVCVGSAGTACVECFAALGMGGCIDCL